MALAWPYTSSVQTCLGRVRATYWQLGFPRATSHFSTDFTSSLTSGTVMHLFSIKSSQETRGTEIGLLVQLFTGEGKTTETFFSGTLRTLALAGTQSRTACCTPWH